MKILIVKPSSLGDVVHALPFLNAVKTSFRDAQITWVISKNLREVLDGNPLIDRIIEIDKESWKKPSRIFRTTQEVIDLVNTLRSEYFDMVIDLQGLLRSGLITFFSNSPLKIGFQHAREGSRLFYNKKIPVNGTLHAVDRCLEIAKFLNAHTERVEFPLHVDDAARQRVKNLLGNISDYIVIAPSARWETKRWKPESFGSLVSKLDHPCVITGSRSDKDIIQQVVSSSGGKGISLCGKTSLKELISLLSGARAVVSNDSGPLHIAAALGVPVVALFGPTDPKRTGPYGWSEGPGGVKNRNIKVIKSSFPCSPCFKKKCKDPLCMSGIRVETVLREIQEYL
jgi:lipopolysaccharide heptosyltransferase I